MKNNFISILITNYNKSKFLNKSLKSVLNQNYRNYEIIIFDDNSLDNSLEIIKKYKNINLIQNNNKKNISPALNQINGLYKAFNISKGNIICLMDSDDFLKKNKLMNINEYFNRNNKKKIVYNLPITEKKKFKIKTKKNNEIWPTIFPTSCISLKRNEFDFFLKNIEKKKYKNLEIDARIVIFFMFYYNQYNILYKKLTFYNFDKDGITAKIPKFSANWWLRRYQAFEYLKFVKSKKNQKIRLSLDYLITTILNFLIKKQ